jgi:hypothetical protein
MEYYNSVSNFHATVMTNTWTKQNGKLTNKQTNIFHPIAVAGLTVRVENLKAAM